MPNVRIDIEYDGSNFCGWQSQPGQRSVQQSLQNALEVILREKIPLLRSSGRTDAGVHARCQTCNFKIQGQPDLTKLIVGVGYLLRGEVSVLRAEYVPDDFNARYSAVQKQYRYHILNRSAYPTFDNGYVWHIPAKLDFEIMQEQAQQLIGKHDFKSFQAVGCQALNTCKDIYAAEFFKANDQLIFSVTGKAFLKQMVRIMVGTLVDFGLKKKLPCSSISELIEKKDRTLAGQTAPAAGLFLEWVKYPD